MSKIQVPTREQVSAPNQQIFDNLKSNLGFVPNLYATLAWSENALSRYMAFSSGKTSLNNREKEVINLAVSQVNNCSYCLAAHSTIGKMNGFTDEQIIQLRKGFADFDAKFNALARLVHEIAKNRGQIDDSLLDNFFEAGYNQENLMDVILAIGSKTVFNLLHNVTHIPIDFPTAPLLSDLDSIVRN